MSTLPFRDTVTFFHKVGYTTYNRQVGTVRCLSTDTAPKENRTATVHIPLYGKRSIVYRAPNDFINNSTDSFTISPGDKFVCYAYPLAEPPSDSFTVSEITIHNRGSRRICHIVVKGTVPPPEEA